MLEHEMQYGRSSQKNHFPNIALALLLVCLSLVLTKRVLSENSELIM